MYDENCNQDEDSYDQNNGLRVYVNKVMIPMGVHFTTGRLISETLWAHKILWYLGEVLLISVPIVSAAAVALVRTILSYSSAKQRLTVSVNILTIRTPF